MPGADAVATEVHTAAATAVTNAVDSARAADAAAAAATTAVSDAQSHVDAAFAAEQAALAALGVAASPADADAARNAAAGARRDLRTWRAAMAEARAAAEDAAKAATRAKAAVDHARQAEADAAAAQSAAAERVARRQRLDAARHDPPTAGVRVDALAAVGGVMADARAALVDQLTGDLLRILDARAAAIDAGAAASRTRLDGMRAARTYVDGVAGARAVHVDALDALQAYVATARPRLDAAVTRLAQVVAAPPISDEAKAAVAAAAHADVADHIEAERTKAAALLAAQAAADVAGWRRRAIEVARPGADPATDAELQAAIDAENNAGGARDAAQTAANDAAGAVTGGDRDALAAWLGAVPVTSWSWITAYLGAAATVRELAQTDPDALVGAASAASDAEGAALQARVDAAAAVAGLGLDLAATADVAATASDARLARLADAVAADA